MPNVPASPCGQPLCPNLRPCEDHPTHNGWTGSRDKRRARTGLSGSAEQKRNQRIMRQHQTTCHVCGEPASDEIDHVIPLAEGGGDDETNLRPIHSRPCHERKTRAERRRGVDRRSARKRGDRAGYHRAENQPFGSTGAADVVAPTRREIETPAPERPKRARSGVWGAQR